MSAGAKGAGTSPGSSSAPPLSPPAVAQLQATAGNRATAGVVSRRIAVQRAIGWTQAVDVARQLEDAMAGWGTDEEAIYGALAGRTGDDMRDIRDAYHQMYSKTLDAELRDELTDSEYARIRGTLEAGADTTMSAAARETDAAARAYSIAEQLHDAMEGLGTDEKQIFNALTGRTPAEIEAVSRAYQASYGVTLEADLRDDLSGGELTRALALIGREDRGTFENRVREDLVEGIHAVVQGQFNYTLSEDLLEVDVPVHFLPAANVTVPLDTWNGQIDGVWNQFSITEPGGREVEVHMALRDDSAASRQIRVIKNTVEGTYANPDRADAGKFYEVMPADTAPHEFGHLIGLPDEYQRTAEDFAAVTGETRTGADNTSGKTDQQVAEELHAALTVDDVAQRAPGATTVLRDARLIVGGVPQQGDFAQAVMQAYDNTYGGDGGTGLAATLQGLPPGTNWTVTMVFSFASGTIMGAAGQVVVQPHEHPVMPRHLREFKAIVANRWPGLDWEIE